MAEHVAVVVSFADVLKSIISFLKKKIMEKRKKSFIRTAGRFVKGVIISFLFHFAATMLINQIEPGAAN